MKNIFRKILKTAAVLCLLACGATNAHAQGVRYDNVVFKPSGGFISYATITVCTSVAFPLVPCTSGNASLFSDPLLTIPLNNPITSDVNGNFGFYTAGGNYTYTVTAAGFSGYSVALTLGAGGGGSPGGPTTAVQSNNNGVLFGDAFFTYNKLTHVVNVPGINLTPGTLYSNGANGAIKPGPNDNEVWVGYTNASDNNDGLSEGSSFASLYVAWNALSGVTTCGQVQCGGTIHIGPNAVFGGPISGQGLQIMGPNDPNWNGGAVPSGWVAQKGVRVDGCVTGGGWGATSAIPQVYIGGNDANHYGIWVSGTNAPLEFDCIAVVQGKMGFQTGINSNNVYYSSGAGTSSLTFNGDAFGESNSVATNGPGMLIGPNTYEVYMHNMVFQANANATPGTQAHQGLVVSDEGTSQELGYVSIYDSHANEGGVEFDGCNYCGVRGLITEGQSDGKGAVWITSTSAFGTVFAENISVADQTGTIPAVENDGGVAASNLFTSGLNPQNGSPNLEGPGVITTQTAAQLQDEIISPLRFGQTGFQAGWTFGKHDDIPAAGGLSSITFANSVAGSTCANWGVSQFAGTSTLTCSQNDRFLGTTAGEATSTSASPQEQLYFTGGSGGFLSHSFSVGDTIIGGVWTQSVNANGYAGNTFVGALVQLQGTGFSMAGSCDGDSQLGDGEWTWNRCLYTITAVGTNPAFVQFAVNFTSTFPIVASFPVLNFIPAGTWSQNQIYSYYNSFKSYSIACTVGTICGELSRPIQASAFLTSTATPATAGILRLANTDTIDWENGAGSGNLALGVSSVNNLTFGGGILAPLTGTPAGGSCIQDVLTGSVVTYVETGNACGSSGGTVTTTGSPANGNLTKFSGSSSITNGNLSGDATTSNSLVVSVVGMHFGSNDYTMSSTALSSGQYLGYNGTNILGETFSISTIFPSENANTVFAGPSSGAAATPAFRALVSNDIPGTIASNTTGNAATATDISTTGANGTCWGVSSGIQQWTTCGSGGSGAFSGGSGSSYQDIVSSSTPSDPAASTIRCWDSGGSAFNCITSTGAVVDTNFGPSSGSAGQAVYINASGELQGAPGLVFSTSPSGTNPTTSQFTDTGLATDSVVYSVSGLLTGLAAPTGDGPFMLGWNNSCSGGATAPIAFQPGFASRELASTDTIACTDNGAGVAMPASGPSGNYALTIPTPTTLGITSPYVRAVNYNATYYIAITPGSGYTINGLSGTPSCPSAACIAPGEIGFIYVDPTISTNYSMTFSQVTPETAGTAGGDLCGTYPDPTVCKIEGGSIPASTAVLATNGSSQIVAATGTGISGVIQGLTGCTNSGYVFTPQGNDCVAESAVTVSVNGGSVSNPNFNGTTPVAGSGFTNVTWQDSSSSVSAEVPTFAASGTQYQMAFYDATGSEVSGNTGITTDANNDLTIVNSSTSSVPLTINAIVSQSGDLADFKVNGAKEFYILSGGSVTTAGNYQCTASCFLETNSQTASITVGGGSAGNASNLGTMSLLGTINSSTGSGGRAVVGGGQNTSTGKQGFTQIEVPAIISTALTVAHEIVCPTSTAYTFAACGTSATNWIGESETTGTGSVYVVIDGTATIVFDGTPTIGDCVQVGTTTAGYAHDAASATCSTLATQIGYVYGDVSGSGSGATATVVFAR